MNWQPIVEHINSATNTVFKLSNVRPLAGGDINSAYCLQGENKAYFVKLNRPDNLAMFSAEAAGLSELATTNTIKTPTPVAYGKTTEHAFLVLEYIEFGSSNKSSAQLFGQQLALLHQQPQSCFGWHRNNTIGSTPQSNNCNTDWIEFWLNQRLQIQLSLAKQNDYSGKLQSLGFELCQHLPAFFDNYHPVPSLVHGDLWGGNAATDKHGNPVIFDPACYYADREVDLAMTELFGGFSQDFYAAYQEAYPIDPGYKTRKTLYNLYHILNHLNLFGSGYLRQAEHMMTSLLHEVS